MVSSPAKAQATIFALSSGMSRAGVAVVRISGPQSRFAIKTMAGPVPRPRMAALRAICDLNGLLIDRGLVLWFPGPNSFTGEDCAEFQVHGSAAVIADVLKALGGIAGCVPAEAGAFARRAFENGKLDLTAVEGLADLINAETSAQRQAALRQVDGALQRLYDDWRVTLVKAMGLVEAAIDFSDEGDVAVEVMTKARPLVESLLRQIAGHVAESTRARGLRDGLTLCIAGPPNAGKSSLTNWLVQRDIAIVDPTAGTTRDRLEARIDVGGVPVTVIDTAGIRDAPVSSIEASGIARAEDAARTADIVIWLDSPDSPGDEGVSSRSSRINSEAEWIHVRNKSDLIADKPVEYTDSIDIFLSVKQEQRLDLLMGRIRTAVEIRAGLTENATASRIRHQVLLADAQSAMVDALREIGDETELVAEHLRRAADGLGRLTGRIDVEDVLGEIFSEFCIGK